MSAKHYNRKPNIEQHEPHIKRGLNSDAPEGQKVTAPIVEPVVLQSKKICLGVHIRKQLVKILYLFTYKTFNQ
jgi:hypothetical protein